MLSSSMRHAKELNIRNSPINYGFRDRVKKIIKNRVACTCAAKYYVRKQDEPKLLIIIMDNNMLHDYFYNNVDKLNFLLPQS